MTIRMRLGPGTAARPAQQRTQFRLQEHPFAVGGRTDAAVVMGWRSGAQLLLAAAALVLAALLCTVVTARKPHADLKLADFMAR